MGELESTGNNKINLTQVVEVYIDDFKTFVEKQTDSVKTANAIMLEDEVLEGNFWAFETAEVANYAYVN